MKPLTKEQAIDIASEARRELKSVYGPRLKGVYLYGSCARGDNDEYSDVDIAVALDRIDDPVGDDKRATEVQNRLALTHGFTVILILMEEADLVSGRFSLHRAIGREGIAV